MANKAEFKTQGDEANPARGKNALEWSIFGTSVLLIGAVLYFLIHQILVGATLPPRLEISLGEPVKAGERILVPVTVANHGDATASSVEVEVTRRNSEETGHFSLPYVPHSGRRKGWVEFDAPLRKSDLKANVLGYEES